jgi:2-polyprenyl-3-methyl-5-hydroxy-6-metoxy-1,4-benzoquinol methylase
MNYDYDSLYADQKDALGAPTPECVAFFETLPNASLRVLDVGCGQGRDALFIARAGHSVVAVDLSPAGIADVIAVATSETLPIRGDVADITTYQPDGDFDIILIDRTLHMLPDADQTAVLTRLLSHVSANGWLLIADEKSNMPRFRAALQADTAAWTTTKDGKGFLFAQRD